MSTEHMEMAPSERSALADRVAAEVRAEMGRQRVVEQKMALAIGLTRSTLNRRTQGVMPFEVDVLGRVADYLNVPVTQFFGVPPKGPEGGLRMRSSWTPSDADIIDLRDFRPQLEPLSCAS